jgi:hypothetical protein
MRLLVEAGNERGGGRGLGDFTRWKEHDAYRRRSIGCCAT